MKSWIPKEVLRRKHETAGQAHLRYSGNHQVCGSLVTIYLSFGINTNVYGARILKRKDFQTYMYTLFLLFCDYLPFQMFSSIIRKYKIIHYHCTMYQDGGMDRRTDRRTDDGQHVIKKVH